MKKYSLIVCLWALIMGLMYVGIFIIGNKPEGTKQPIYVEYFKQGDTLLPDYACPDTMIVTNSIELNKVMALFEQGYLEDSDSDIDSVIHLYAMPINDYSGSFLDQFLRLRALEPTWDSLKIATAINED